MILSIVLILMIGIIAFFHYTQGFFSATISCMLVVISAVLAVSYDETVVELVLKGKAADVSHAMVLCMLFAIGYIVPPHDLRRRRAGQRPHPGHRRQGRRRANGSDRRRLHRRCVRGRSADAAVRPVA